MSLNEEILRIEKEEARLARRKEELAAELEKKNEQRTKLEDLYKASGYANPKDLVEALIDLYAIRVTKRLRGTNLTRRKRTKITPELRAAVKKEVKSGVSMNQASKKFAISYAVVAKIMKGAYDKSK